MADNCAGEYSMPERMNNAPRNGVTTAPTALNDWARFSLAAELSAGPSTVTYGLAPTSRNDCPDDITNSAKRKNAYTPMLAAGINRRAPVAQIKSPARMPP